MPRTEHGLTYITREDWGARYGRGHAMPAGRKKGKLVVHHTWKPHRDCGRTRESLLSTVRGIEAYQQGEWGRGISYEFLADQDGRAVEGIGWGRVGTHTAGQNTDGLAVCLILDGDTHAPTDAAMEAIRDVAAASVRGGFLAEDYTVHGHDDFSAKSCPGKLVRARFREITPARMAFPILRIGARGTFVETLQRAMGMQLTPEQGLGKFGPLTEKAVMDLQRRAGLVPDGVVGEKTWGALGFGE